MKNLITLCIAFVFVVGPVLSQDSVKLNTGKYPSPYKTSLITDGAIIAGGVGLTALGVNLIKNKKDFTKAEIDAIKVDNIPFFDRGNAGYYSAKIDQDSYIPFHISFGMPVVMALLNKNERQNIGQVLVLYTETMAITGALFTLATGNVYRTRPYVYGKLVSDEMKMDNDSHRAFYAGHTAASAAATFFMAKTFADFNPTSKARPYVWAVAATVPAIVGYMRYKAGMHFLSDNILGYVLGAGAGILVPQLHKSKMMKNVSIAPMVGDGFKGLAVTYHIR